MKITKRALLKAIGALKEEHKLITLHSVLNALNVTNKEYHNWSVKHVKDSLLIKNNIITNLLDWGSKDPRRITLIKFYLEAFEREFFVDKGINTDNDGIIFNFTDISEIKYEND